MLHGRTASQRDEFTARHWNGRISVVRRNPSVLTRSALIRTVDEVGQTLFGRTLHDEEWAALVGAPDASEVTIAPSRLDHGDELAIELRHPWVHDYALRRVFLQGRALIVRNEFLTVVPTERTQGIGTRMLAIQVGAAAQLGAARIETEADGRPGSRTRVGYYVWGRLGFNGAIRPAVRAALPTSLRDSADINALMFRQAGPEWWQGHGHAFEGTFDLAAGSRSRQILEAYTAEKGILV